MKKSDDIFSSIGQVGSVIGQGLLAGLIGTAAITLSQMIEMKITGRKASTGPADAAAKTLNIHPQPQDKKKMTNVVHWTYGSAWGIARGILALAGVKRWSATTAHFAAILGTAIAMTPLEGQQPITKWTGKQIITEALHHAVYAVAAGLVFDAITGEID